MTSRFVERRQQNTWTLESAIIEAVAYFSLFQYPLTAWEIWSFLPGKGELLVVKREIERLVNEGKLQQRWGYYFLPGETGAVDCRLERYPITIAKIKRAKKVAKWLRWLPGVQFIALVNVMGSYNLRADSDIDLFIVTRPGSLWFCRFWANLMMQIAGLRPTDENRSNKICLSFWLASSDLRLDRFKLPDKDGYPDWYYIYWLANLRPLVEQGINYQQIIKNNPWLKTYLPNWRVSIVSQSQGKFWQRVIGGFSRLGIFWARIWESTLAYWQQKFLPASVRTLMNIDERVVVTKEVIKLHIIDRREYYRDKLRKKLEALAQGKQEMVQVDKAVKRPHSNRWIKLGHIVATMLVLILPWSTRWIVYPGQLGGEFWEYGTISIYISDILLVLSCLALKLGKSKLAPVKDGSKKRYLIWLSGLWLISAISLVVNNVAWPLIIFYLLRLVVWSAGWYFLLGHLQWTWRRWSTLWIVSLIFPAILGLGQFMSQTASANKWLGLASHYPGDLGIAVIESTNAAGEVTGRWLRAYGSFDHPNILGALMAIVIIFIMVASQYYDSNLSRFLLFASVGLWSLASLASWSRAAWLAILFGWIISLIISQRKDRHRRHFLIMFFVGLLLWSGLWLWPFQDLGRSRVSGEPRLEQKSLVERQESYGAALAVIKQHPWLGVGLGNYTGFLSKQDNIVRPAWDYQPVHNSFLLIISEIGLLGFVWLVMGLIMILWSAGQRLSGVVWPLAASFIWLLFMDHWWWSLHSGIVYFWLIVSSLYWISRQPRNLL